VPQWNVRATLVLACNLLGDSICRLPAIRATKTTYPDSHLCVVTDPRCREVFEDQTFIDEVWLLDRRGAAFAQARAWTNVAMRARRLRPDLVLDLYGSWRTALLSWLTGARFRTGSHREGSSRWYNLGHLIDRSGLQAGHIIERVNEIAAPAGIAPPATYVPLAVTESNREQAIDRLSSLGFEAGRPLILLNPGARVEAKRWRAERFAALPKAASETAAQWAVITAPGDESRSAEVAEAARGKTVALPALRLRELAALMERAAALVTGDTGILHLAGAMGLPSVVTAGPTSPELFAHPGVRQRVLFHREACDEWIEGEECVRYNTCSDRRCIDAVTVEEVAASLRELLSGA
jgi:ADP-heptose:LPS heptosyltransferase